MGRNLAVWFFCAWLAASGASARADQDASAAPKSNEPKKINVDALKEKYWAKGSEPDLEVVQNRIYTKAHKLNLELMAGSVSGDPFLNTLSYGGLLGFNFTEALGIDVLYWKLKSTPSSATDAFVSAVGYGTNSNPLQSLVGGEINWAILYGKLSLLGKAILHFDLFLYGGAGQLQTTNNSSIAPWIGIGQQLYLARWLSFRVDYRYMKYTNNVVELFRPDTLGQVINQTTIYSGALSAGLNFLLF